ncbi:hypothetical protein [Wenzhouxiangella marina]|uniref:Uncharacterized protein n=1 Tax=Wenzhouxiangella marina TaxID=1579979 RepID=A0A0K0XTZ8_9GAMM|nr:hypothetical protein [Wenzhouxiangella marina]AKS41135.1 hypothetical protein WM2015_754 [Wenzhouxiangella marina]MBB6088014.1 hypothetical protein [Wenzhouxiangella marina]
MRIRWPAALLLLIVTGVSAERPAGATPCVFPDVAGMTPVPLQAGASAPAGIGGDLPGGRWELITLRYTPSIPLTIVGEGISAIELDAVDGSSGISAAVLDFEITSPTATTLQQTGAGPYLATGVNLAFTNDCGDALALGGSEYSVETDGPDPILRLWGAFDVQLTDPIPITVTIQLEAVFELVEPQIIEDPVFEDRFEQLP